MASLKDIKSIKISGAVEITVPGTMDVPESMLYYLKNQPDGRTTHQGMVWRLIARSSGYFGRYAERARNSKVTNSDEDVTDGWVFYSFATLMRYYFYGIVGSVTFVDADDLLNPAREDAEFIKHVFMPLIIWLETVCDVILIFTEPKQTDPMNNLANAIQSVANAASVHDTQPPPPPPPDDEDDGAFGRGARHDISSVSPNAARTLDDPKTIRYIVYKVEATNSLDRVDGITIESSLRPRGLPKTFVFVYDSEYNTNDDNTTVDYFYKPEEYDSVDNEIFDFGYLPPNGFDFKYIEELRFIVCKKHHKYLVIFC